MEQLNLCVVQLKGGKRLYFMSNDNVYLHPFCHSKQVKCRRKSHACSYSFINLLYIIIIYTLILTY